MPVPRLLPLLFLHASLLLLPAQGEESKPAPAAGEGKHEPERSPLSVTEHTVTIAGQPLKYKATAGYLTLKEENNQPAGSPEAKGADPTADPLKPKARIFFVAYTLDGPEAATRPVTFAFNGGPGAASVWLHLGALGPRRVRLTEEGDGTPPPYRLVDNEGSWLDRTDLVFIDPVSTGFSRAVPGQNPKAFHGYQEDLQAVAEFIRLYTTENGRWLSPKFLVGESYGGTRAAALAETLQERFDLYLNGIVLVSGVLSWQTIDFQPGNLLPYVLAVPSYAATAWHHHKLPPELQQLPLAEVRRQAEAFAGEAYPAALAKGTQLPPEERRQVAARLAAFTGLPLALILHYDLRVPTETVRDELLKGENRVVGRFDSRRTGVASHPEGNDYDPSFTTLRGNFTGAANAYLRGELKFSSELPYHSLADVFPWNFGSFQNRYVEVGNSLASAIVKNPHLKVWVLSGYYDLAVPYFANEYALRQLHLDPSLAANVRATSYESGHMIYLQEKFLKGLQEEFGKFVDETLR